MSGKRDNRARPVRANIRISRADIHPPDLRPAANAATEPIRASKDARNSMIDLEDTSEGHLKAVKRAIEDECDVDPRRT